jgi:hypothetical protein
MSLFSTERLQAIRIDSILSILIVYKNKTKTNKIISILELFGSR